MRRRIIILVQFLALIGCNLFNQVDAQELSMRRSTLSIGGASKTYNNKGKQYTIQQSIGQSSVIDSYQANGFVLMQGFIQSLDGLSNQKQNNYLHALVSPNPFSNSIRISFSDEISDNLYVSVCSLHGRVVYSDACPKSQELYLNLINLSPGFYIIRVNSGSKYFAAKVIKK